MECFTADFLEFSSTNVKIGFWLLLVGWLGIHKRVEALGPFNPVRGLVGCIQGRGLGAGARLAFRGLSCRGASVALCLWFRF